MDRMIFVSDDETSTCYVENKLSAPQGGVRKKVKLLYPLQCHNAATARKARGGGWGWESWGDLQALASPGWPLGLTTLRDSLSLPAPCHVAAEGMAAAAKLGSTTRHRRRTAGRWLKGIHAGAYPTAGPAPGHTKSPKT